MLVNSCKAFGSVLAVLAAAFMATANQTQAESSDAGTWAKAAIRIKDGHCWAANAPSQVIPAPDRQTVAKLVCHDSGLTLRIERPTGGSQIFQLRDGATELLWAPDSTSFLINGAENAITNYLEVYQRDASRWRRLNVTKSAQQDMVRSYPPCKAFNRDDKICERIASNPEFNMVGLAWSKNSSTLIVMAEVPCSSYYGGIMCQIQGYEIGVPDGTIIRRMTASDLKSRWQQRMGLDLRIPEPPVYGPAQRRD